MCRRFPLRGSRTCPLGFARQRDMARSDNGRTMKQRFSEDSELADVEATLGGLGLRELRSACCQLKPSPELLVHSDSKNIGTSCFGEHLVRKKLLRNCGLGLLAFSRGC